MLSIGEVCLGRRVSPQPIAFDRSSPHDASIANGLRRRVAAVVAEHVLVTTDGSDVANRVIPFALDVIRACGSPRVTLLRVLAPNVGKPVHALESAMALAHAEAGLERLKRRFPTPDKVVTVVAEGSAADQILHYVEAHDVDLVVIASHGRDEARTWPTGSTTRKVSVSGLTSVLVVPTEPEVHTISSIMVPLDGSARAECVLPIAVKLAVVHDAELVLVHVVPRPEFFHRMPAGPHERDLIEELTQLNRERAEANLASVRDRLTSRGIRARIVLLADTNPGRAIERFARESPCDLVLICAHGAGCQQGERHGSTAKRLLDSVVKPMWIVQDLPVNASVHS